jgi:hypothetical protein
MKHISILLTLLICGMNTALAQDASAKCKNGDYDACKELCDAGDQIGCDALNLKTVNPEELVPETRNQVIDSNTKGFTNEFRIGVGVSSERWSDSSFPTVYGKSGKAIPTVSLNYRIFKNMSLDVEAGMARLNANSDRNIFQVVPVTAGVSFFATKSQNIEPFIGVGAGFVQFSEQLLPLLASTTPTVTAGTKFGVDYRVGVRIPTRFSMGSQHPTASQGAKQMDVEIYVGQRIHHAFGIGTGLNMNAFRVSSSMKFRF